MSNENPVPQFVSGGNRVDLEITGTRITSIVRFEDEFILMFSGGEGRFYSPLTDKMVEFPIIIDMTFTVSIPDGTDEAEAVLAQFQNTGTPVVLIGAPNTPYVIVDKDGTSVSIPRNSTWN